MFIALAAVATLAACSKIEYEQEVEIGFSPVVSNITKAMQTGTTFPAEDFNVWAYYKQVTAGTTIADWQASSADQQGYIIEKPFEKQGTDALWGGKVEYYWPKVGSLMFVGYYPTSIASKVDYTFTSSVNKMTIAEYTPGMVTSNATHEEDLMYFNMTPASYNGSTTGSANISGNNVDVVFRHALSWISVVLAKSSTTPDNATIKVNSVAFTGIKPTGTGTVNNSPVSPETNEITWVASGTPNADGIIVTETGGHVLTKNNTTPLDKQPLFIPQPMDGCNLVVNYTISSTDGSAFTETKTIPLKIDALSLTNWAPAKHYTYTITIATSEILIDPTVTGWDSVNVPLPIQ